MFLTAPKYLRPANNTYTASKSVDSIINDAFNAFDSQFPDIWSMTAANFPPYNIMIDKDGKEYVIEIAAAGFSRDEIQIESENNLLTITGVREPRDQTKDKITYLTHGIAYRNFTRSFTLALNIVVGSATFEDGLLKIKLIRVMPEAKKKNLIQIT